MNRCIVLGRPRQSGISLLEALVAVVALGFGSLAAARLHAGLRDHGDIARQRSEAVRLGAQELEGLRAYSQLGLSADVPSFAAIADADRVVDSGSGFATNTAYRISRRVDDAAIAGTKATRLTVRWEDRSGATQDMVLETLIVGAEPKYSGALGLGAGTPALRGVLGRAAAIPVTARDLGDGRSAWKPVESGTTALVFDNASGAIVARCTGVAASTASRDLVVADLSVCESGTRLLVSGTIRFTSAVPPLPGAANDTPLEVALAVALEAGPYPGTPECGVAALKTVRYSAGGSLRVESVPLAAAPASAGVAAWEETGERFADYHCTIAPRADGRWSGVTTLVPRGWTIGGGPSDRRVCRFTGEAGRVHPAAYVDIGAALQAENFLVVAAGQACPAAPPVRLTGEGRVVQAELTTAQHQP